MFKKEAKVDLQEAVYVPKSLSVEFARLSNDEKAEVLLEDASHCSDIVSLKLDPSSADGVEMNMALYAIGRNYEIINNVKKFISIMRKYNIEDYKIVAKLIFSKALESIQMSAIDFIKKFFLSIDPCAEANDSAVPKVLDKYKKEYVGTPNKKPEVVNEQPKESNKEPAKENTNKKKENPNKKDNSNKSKDESNKQNKTEAKTEVKVDVQESTGAAKTILPSDIVNNVMHNKDKYNSINNAEQETPQIPKVVPIHPELNINQKAELLKRRIEFNHETNKSVDAETVDSLLRLIEMPYLQTNLVNNYAKDGRLYQTMNYQYDKKLFNYAFYAETNIPDKVIIVLYNTKMEFNNNVGWVNNLTVYLDDASKVKNKK